MGLSELTSEELSRKPRLGALHLGYGGHSRERLRSFVRSIVTANGRRSLRLALHSNGASAIRLHFKSFDAGNGEVWMYAVDGARSSPLLVDGPYRGRGPLDGGDFWSAAIQSRTLVLNSTVPAAHCYPPPKRKPKP
jgi:hypothetical protein